jgi:hypothetical protein
MGRVIGFLVCLVIYGNTKNIWLAGFVGAISMVILDAILQGSK